MHRIMLDALLLCIVTHYKTETFKFDAQILNILTWLSEFDGTTSENWTKVKTCCKKKHRPTKKAVHGAIPVQQLNAGIAPSSSCVQELFVRHTETNNFFYWHAMIWGKMSTKKIWSLLDLYSCHVIDSFWSANILQFLSAPRITKLIFVLHLMCLSEIWRCSAGLNHSRILQTHSRDLINIFY